jgi:hypothetical protein
MGGILYNHYLEEIVGEGLEAGSSSGRSSTSGAG